MGPFSGLLFIVGVIMFFVGRDRNNDELFSWSWRSRSDSPEVNRIMFMIYGIVCIIAAVVMWIYMAINGDPDPPPDLNSIMAQKTSSH